MGRIQGINFWNQCYRNTNLIFFNNRIKWLQYQIIRGTLKTNRIVSKFADSVTSTCTFCEQHTETIIHLFWECTHVIAFLRNVSLKFQQNDNKFFHHHSLKSFIFNNSNNFLSPITLAALYMKLYIWNSRCKKNVLNADNFNNFFMNEIRLLKMSFPEDKMISAL